MNTLFFRTLSTVAVAAFALAACRIEKPSTVIPAVPTIESFTASERNVEKGGSVTLSWKTSNATAIELREVSTGELGVPVNTLEGSHEVNVQVNSLFVLVAKSESGTDARALSVLIDEGASSQLSLQAVPPSIMGGGRTTLVWTAPGATEVTLTANGQPLSTEGQLTTGAVTVSPTVDTTYVLTADDRTAQAQVTVQPAILIVDASPRAAEPGGNVTVSWTAAGAERVTVSSPGRGLLHEATGADVTSGAYTDTVPTLPNNSLVTYVVAAIKGTETIERTVEVNVGTGIAITRFDAPPVAAANGPYQVRWETRAASVIELRLDGTTVYRSPSRTEAAAGFFALTAGAADFALEIIATNDLGGEARQLAQVDTVGVPTSITFSATPATIMAGQPVTITWESAEVRRVRVTTSSGEAVFGVTGQAAESGSATIYVSATTTLTLAADNLLGSAPLTATADVTVTGVTPLLTRAPVTPLSGQNVQLNALTPGALLHGFPHAEVLSSNQADFRDISGTGSRLLDVGADVASVTLPFSTQLWGQRQSGPLTVSRAGWMAFGAAQTVLTSEPSSLPSTSAPAGVIAPYWDDLQLIAGSGVYAQVVGSAPNEVLIVQWDKMRIGSSGSNTATFQAQIHQRGTIAFHYKTMTLNSAPSFLIGVQNPERTLAVRSTGAPASNTARYFFSPVAPPVDVRVLRGSRYGGYVQAGEVYTLVNELSGAISIPLDLTMTEVMSVPSPALGLSGQYFELVNKTTAPLDLSSWRVGASGVSPFVLPDGFTLAPGVVTVIGASSDPALNDDAGVLIDWAGSGFALPIDGGSFTAGTADGGVTFSLPRGDAGAGVALEFDLTAIGTSGGPPSCAATTPFGSQTPQQLGSPGARGYCVPYTLQSIPVHFVDISDGGTATGATADNGLATITFGPDGGANLPVVFGVPVPRISASANGYILPIPETTGAHVNKTVPGTERAGSIAPFWDDLVANTGGNVYWKHFAAGEDALNPASHWVVQWANYTHWLSRSATPPDSLNFEVKLFENGTVEFHYGTMSSGTDAGYATGIEATAWLENPAGTAALPIGINQAVIQPNTAYRFVPR